MKNNNQKKWKSQRIVEPNVSQTKKIKFSSHQDNENEIENKGNSFFNKLFKSKDENSDVVNDIPRQTDKRNTSFSYTLSARDKMVFVVLSALAVILVVGIFFINNLSTTFKVPTNANTYYLGDRYALAKDTKLQSVTEDSTVIKGSNELEVSRLPIYYENQQTVLLPYACIYEDPSEDNWAERINVFTEISIKDGGVYADNNGKEYFLQKGFVYDGGDVYLFLEPMTVSFNNYKIDLPPLSFAMVEFTGKIMLYNSQTGEQYNETPQGDVIATSVGNGYKISLVEDAITNSEGQRRLIFGEPSKLESLF